MGCRPLTPLKPKPNMNDQSQSQTEDEKPTERLGVRVTPSEKRVWEASAKAEGVTVSTLIRRKMGQRKFDRPPAAPKKQVVYAAADPALLAALAKIGANLNQLSRVANMKGDLPTLVQLAALERALQGLRDDR